MADSNIKNGKKHISEKFPNEAAKLKAQNEKLIAVLKEIQIHYNHPDHDHNWANWVYERVSKALRDVR